MVLKLIIKFMLQCINQDIDNSYFCDNRMFCSMYGCFCALFRIYACLDEINVLFTKLDQVTVIGAKNA